MAKEKVSTKKPVKNTPPITFVLDWSVLYTSVSLLGISLLISMVAIGGVYYYVDWNKAWKEEQARNLKEVENEYAKIQETVNIIKQNYHHKLEDLSKKGFFQLTNNNIPEQEYNIIFYQSIIEIREKVKDIAGGLILPAVAVEANNQENPLQNLKLNFTPVTSLHLYEIRLNVKLGLLHEEDLLRFLRKLERESFNGLLNIRFCEIKRLAEPRVIEAPKSFFEANCEISLFTSRVIKS